MLDCIEVVYMQFQYELIDRYSTQVDATGSTSEILLSAVKVIPSNAGSVFLNSVV